MDEPLSNNDEVEDGEISDSSEEEVYIPLQRPTNNESGTPKITTNATEQMKCDNLPEELSQTEEISSSSSSTTGDSSSSDACLEQMSSVNTTSQKKRKRRRKGMQRAVMVRVPHGGAETDKRARFKKYNVWMTAIHEELTENMRGCDVTHNYNDRNVENYDFTLRDRLNGGNSLKRRLSNRANSTDMASDEDDYPAAKRGRSYDDSMSNNSGHRKRDEEYARTILDLDDTSERDAEDIAREITNKLYEDNDELLVRVLQVLGTELPLEIYKETQRIEANGGMMIKNGTRRRTPGGVFLFLLKNHERLSPDDHKSIFSEAQQQTKKRRKDVKAISRDRKVEELKKRLSAQETILPVVSMQKDKFSLGADLNAESNKSNLSNPPPSPVGQEQSPEYKTHAINNIALDASPSPEKPSTSFAALASSESPSKPLVSYNDDFLDLNAGEMDFL